MTKREDKQLGLAAVNAERHGQKMQRVSKVSELLMSGLTGPQIFQYVTEKLGWPVKQRIVLDYIHAANELFAEEAKIKSGDEFGKGLRRLNMLFAASLKIQDYKACLAIQREINLMMGFTNRSITEHTGEVKNTTNTKIQIEYIHSKKEIATSEDQVDEKRTIHITDAQIIDDNDASQPASGTESPAPVIPSEQTIQTDQGVQGQNNNPPGGYEFF